MEEEIQAKHKKELKEFDRDKRSALKHVKATSGKGKKAKEKLEEAEKEWDSKLQSLQKKHEEELASFTTSTTTYNTITNSNDDNNEPSSSEAQENKTTINEQKATKEEEQNNESQQQLSAKEKALAKRLRKKQQALLKEKQRQEEIENEIANAPNPRLIEINAMKELYLNPNQLDIEEIAADGNCLYRAVARQMEHSSSDNNSSSSSSGHDYLTIRKICADQLMKLREEYEPFADLDYSNVSSFEEYVEKVRDSSEWGGHLELRALANALQKTIVVYSADGAPLYIGGDGDNNDEEGRVIRLSFHKKYYALGEHYNSVVPRQ